MNFHKRPGPCRFYHGVQRHPRYQNGNRTNRSPSLEPICGWLFWRDGFDSWMVLVSPKGHKLD